MAKFIVTAPDGKEYEITAPEGATQEQVLEYAQANFQQASTTEPDMRAGRGTNRAPESPQQVLPSAIWNRLSPERQEAYSRSLLPSYARGEPSSGFTAGIEDLPMGAAQLGANIFSLLQRGELNEGVNQQMRERERMIEESRKKDGREGFDLARLGGGIFSPSNIPISRGLDKMRPTSTVTGDLTQAGLTGGAIGVLQPSVGENFFGDKATQAGLGIIFGAVSKGAIDLVGKMGSLASGLTGKGRKEALRQHINELAGEDRDAVITALQNAKEVVTGSRPTVGEILADIPGAIDLVAKQAKIATLPGLRGKFEKRITENQAARVRELQRISGTQAQRDRLRQTRDQRTGETREQALSQADEARTTLGEIDRRANREAADLIERNRELFPEDIGADGRFVSVLPTSEYDLTRQVVNRTRALKDTQLRMLEQNGTYPIYAKDLLAEIDARIAKEGTDVGQQALRGIRAKIASKADERGILSSRDLYDNVRKTINQDIETLLEKGQKPSASGLPQQAAKAAADIKKAIDGSINKTSNGLWSKYLTDYQKYSQKLDRMEVGRYLLDKLQQPGVEPGDVGLKATRVGAFATGVESAASTIKRATGQPRTDRLDLILSPKEVLSVGNVLKDLTREQRALTQGRGPALEGGVPNAGGILPPFISAGVTVVRSALSAARERSNAKFNKDLGALFLEPQDFVNFMSSVSDSQATTLGRVFYDLADDANKRLLTSLFTVPALAQSVGRPEEF